MGPHINQVETDLTLPKQVDLVIIGGGIVGISAALAAAERGHSVLVCEKGVVSGEQSSRNQGWVRKLRRDRREIPLAIAAQHMWDGMSAKLGVDVGFRRGGITMVADTDADINGYETWLKSVRNYDVDSSMVSGTELERLLPGATKTWKAALTCPSDGRAEPQRATAAMVSVARRHGAKIMTDCAVRGVDTANGRVIGVVTEHGRVACNAVIVAAGAWSRRFLSDLDITLPQLKMRATVGRTTAIEGLPETNFWGDGASFRKRLDGGATIANAYMHAAPITPDSFRFFFDFLPALKMEWKGISLRFGKEFFRELADHARVPLDRISPYEKIRILDPKPDMMYLHSTLRQLQKDFPIFQGARIAQAWAGMVEVTPDAVPVISKIDSLSGLVIASGFSAHGFAVGPAAGTLACDLATGHVPIVDPYEFRLSRYTDGSNPKIMVGPSASVEDEVD